MATAPKYQIFISSTYEDLRDERDQVIRAVLEMGHIPVGMEMFSAADEEQWQIISRHIEESDYYAVVVAHRLGSVTPEGVSYTRKEYEYARELGIPCLGFILDDKASWPADRVDTGTGVKKALEDFKALVREKPVSFWATAEDLHGKFSIALMKAFTAQPREGWVRASEAGGGPRATAEILRLSAENGELRRRLAQADAEAAKEEKEEKRETLATLFRVKKRPAYRYKKNTGWQNDVEVSLFDIFRTLAPLMVVEASVEKMASSLAMEIRSKEDEAWDIVALNQVRSMMADFMTLDLIQPSARKHPVSDTNEYWSLSSTGLEILKAVRKVSLGTGREAADAENAPQGETSPEEEQSANGGSDEAEAHS